MDALTLDLLYVVPPLVVYALVVLLLHRRGLIGQGKPLALLGPMLLVKTVRGRETIDRLGRRFSRGWNVFGDLGIALAFVGMIAMFALLAWSAWKATTIPASAAPALSEAVTIPGLNPLLPLGYGLLALIVAVVLHELCHGVLARANGIGVKSLGVIFLVIPLGAFVEQDEKEMMAAPARKRDRVAAAGVMANFVLALLFFFVMAAVLTSSVHAKADGVGVLSVIGGTPAANTTATMGPDGLQAGDIITSFNGTSTPTVDQLKAAIAGTHPGETVPVQWYSQAASGIVTADITLTAAVHYPNTFSGNSSLLAATAFLGVGETLIPPSTMLALLSEGAAAPGTGPLLGTNDVIASSALFLALPATGELPIQGVMAQFYTVSGPLGPADTWIVVNTLYWLVWVDLLLGIFNALPAVPLDGGFLFRDVAGGFFKRLRPSWTEARREGAAAALSTLATLTVFFLIIWEVFAPHL